MLDMHYWKECPMLTSCKFCGQVVEIMTMNIHMLEECEKRAKFGKGFIADLDENMDKCPLCQITVAPLTETGWKNHLLRGKGCVKNPRTAHLRKKQTM
jgi:centrosomal protein CEP104